MRIIIIALILFHVLIVAGCIIERGSCYDGIRNQHETGIDCGGECEPCPSCDDGIQNQDEEDVDCGGSCPDDCETCYDGIQNQNETGVDCGGECWPCETCNDGILNQNELGIDCGGVCADCPPVVAPCNVSPNTANLNIYNDSFSSISYGYESLNASGSSMAVTIMFAEDPIKNNIYATGSTPGFNRVNVKVQYSYQTYYAEKDQDVYVNINGDSIFVEYCNLNFEYSDPYNQFILTGSAHIRSAW